METFVLAKIALSDFGTTLVVVVVQELPLMESKPVKVLGRPAKTDALSGVWCKSSALLHYGVHSLMVEPEVVVLLVSVQFWVHTP